MEAQGLILKNIERDRHLCNDGNIQQVCVLEESILFDSVDRHKDQFRFAC